MKAPTLQAFSRDVGREDGHLGMLFVSVAVASVSEQAHGLADCPQALRS
ncbi:hypothetical protein [Marinobacter caseinilyticus]|nr:hypothetical protein [Marinobacter caseinilyticus]